MIDVRLYLIQVLQFSTWFIYIEQIMVGHTTVIVEIGKLSRCTKSLLIRKFLHVLWMMFKTNDGLIVPIVFGLDQDMDRRCGFEAMIAKW